MIKKILKNTQPKIEKYVKNKNSSILVKPYFFAVKMLKPFYFTNEFLLMFGFKRKSKSSYDSIIFFTVHKSASTFIKQTIFKLIKSENITPVDFSTYWSASQQLKNYNSQTIMKSLLVKKGHFYGAIRNFYDFPDLDKFKVLLVLRDPRDVLTSHYFSTLYNHPLGRIEIYKDRQKYANQSIDDFVLEHAEALNTKYRNYIEYLLGKKNVLFLKYEDMISDFKNWMDQLCNFLGSTDESVRNEIISTTTFTVKKEDPNSFIRNIKAGDHKNKLQPETIDKLNKIFGEVLVKLDYDL